MHTGQSRLSTASPSWIIRDDRMDRNAMAWALAVALAVHLFFLLFVDFPRAGPTLPKPIEPTESPQIVRPTLPPPPMPESSPVVRVTRQPALPVPFPVPAPPAPLPEGVVIDLETPVPPMRVQIGEPVPPDPPPGPLRPGIDSVTHPSLIPESKIAPIYPELARRARLSGLVIVQAVILEDGTVGETKVLQCDRPGVGFEEAATEAITQWRYEPSRLHGRSVDVYFTVIVEFTLQ